MGKETSADPNLVTHEVIASPGQVVNIREIKKSDDTLLEYLDKDGKFGAMSVHSKGMTLSEPDQNQRWYNDLPIGPWHIRKEQLLKVGISGAWDSVTINDPWLIRKGDTYYLFYGGYDGTHARIGFATSQNLYQWTKGVSNPVFQEGAGGQWDDKFASKASILQIGSTYYMYYEGMNVAELKQIGLATSTDLVTWTRSLLNPVLSPGLEPGAETTVNILAPSVLEKDGVYYMLYAGQPNGAPDYRWRIYYATSTNGIAWTKQGKLLDVTADTWDAGWVGVPSIIRVGAYYVMAYCACSSPPPSPNSEPPPEGLGMAYSTDLVTWTKSVDNPVMTSETWRMFVKTFWRPHLVNTEGKVLMFFNASGAAFEEIFIAVPAINSIVPDMRDIDLQGNLFAKGICILDASDGHEIDWSATAKACGAKWYCNMGTNHGINTIGDSGGFWRVQTEVGIGNPTWMEGQDKNYNLREGGLGLYAVFREYSNADVFYAVGFSDDRGALGPLNTDCVLICLDTRVSANYVVKVARSGVVKNLDTGVVAPGNLAMKWELRQTATGMDVYNQDKLVLQIGAADMPVATTGLRKMIMIDNLGSAVLNWLDIDCFIPVMHRWCEV